MSLFGVNKWYLVAAGVVAVAVGLLTAFWAGYREGDVTGTARCQVAHATEQLKVTEDARKSYDKIDRKTPINADKSARIEWLFDNATSNGR